MKTKTNLKTHQMIKLFEDGEAVKARPLPNFGEYFDEKFDFLYHWKISAYLNCLWEVELKPKTVTIDQNEYDRLKRADEKYQNQRAFKDPDIQNLIIQQRNSKGKFITREIFDKAYGSILSNCNMDLKFDFKKTLIKELGL